MVLTDDILQPLRAETVRQRRIVGMPGGGGGGGVHPREQIGHAPHVSRRTRIVISHSKIYLKTS